MACSNYDFDICMVNPLAPAIVPGKIGIATVLYNSSQVLEDFLSSLRRQTYSNYVVYAVDNDSQDDSVRRCQEAGERFVVIENEDNTGFAHGTNQGITRALAEGCEFVLILNNDVVFESDFLEQLIAGIQRTQSDIVAPLTYYHDRPNVIWAAGGKLQRWMGYRPVHLGMGQEDTGQFSQDLRIQFAPGSGIFARQSVFAKTGLFDENFYTYWEDTDFAVRCLKAGLRTYLIPFAKMWHKVSSLAGKNSPFQQFYAIRNHALYIQKHCSPLEAYMLNGLYMNAYRVNGWLRGKQDERIAVWKEGIALAQKCKYGSAQVHFL
jgi:GT2 family glycosyltransferase